MGGVEMTITTNMLLRVDEVGVHYGSLRAVDGVSITVREGETVGLIGPNGAGKSTLMNCIAGLVPASCGEVWFEGGEVTRRSSTWRARNGIGRTFQNLELFGSMSVRDNVQIAAEGGTRLRERWRSIDLSDRVDQVLESFGLVRDQHRLVGELSYANRKLVEFARAFVRENRLLLLDEPAAGVAVEDRARLIETVRAQIEQSNATVVVVEHDMSVVRGLCGAVHVLDSGQLIASGSFDEVMARSDVREAYLGVASVGN